MESVSTWTRLLVIATESVRLQQRNRRVAFWKTRLLPTTLGTSATKTRLKSRHLICRSCQAQSLTWTTWRYLWTPLTTTRWHSLMCTLWMDWWVPKLPLRSSKISSCLQLLKFCHSSFQEVPSLDLESMVDTGLESITEHGMTCDTALPKSWTSKCTEFLLQDLTCAEQLVIKMTISAQDGFSLPLSSHLLVKTKLSTAVVRLMNYGGCQNLSWAGLRMPFMIGISI